MKKATKWKVYLWMDLNLFTDIWWQSPWFHVMDNSCDGCNFCLWWIECSHYDIFKDVFRRSQKWTLSRDAQSHKCKKIHSHSCSGIFGKFMKFIFILPSQLRVNFTNSSIFHSAFCLWLCCVLATFLFSSLIAVLWNLHSLCYLLLEFYGFDTNDQKWTVQLKWLQYNLYFIYYLKEKC